jgi:hypothetical protein
MALSPAQVRNPSIHGPLGSLWLSGLQVKLPAAWLRAFRWHHDLSRLGVRLPLFIVADVGFHFAVNDEYWELAPVTDESVRDKILCREYRAVLSALFTSAISARARALKLSDDLVVVLLARVLGPLAKRVELPAAYPTGELLTPDLAHGIEAELPALFAACDRSFETRAVETFVRRGLHFLTSADAIDLDTLKLLGMFGSASIGALGHVDLLAAVESVAANDIVNFSLELLPSVLETTRNKGTGTHATDGYAGMGSKGSVDSMVLSELAWDEAEFARRFIENETLYYTREEAQDDAKRVQYILIDASASMRGDREVFARGVALALVKKLQLQGEDVWVRFFDSRLYDIHKARAGALPAAQLLGFRGERGRNPARVFAQLATELTLLRQRERRDPVVHLITHAALHVPKPLVAEVQAVAQLFGIFIVPSGGKLDLDYLDLLRGHSIVSHETLAKTSSRKEAGERVVRDAAAVASLRPAAL